jgi:hypothetical protein
MLTRDDGLSSAVHDIGEHAHRLVRLEAKLAALELREKASRIGVGVALLVGGTVLGLFALGFLLAALSASLATFLPTSIALLIVGSVLVLVTAGAVVAGLSQVRKGAPPIPEQAVAEARLTGEALRGDGDV